MLYYNICINKSSSSSSSTSSSSITASPQHKLVSIYLPIYLNKINKFKYLINLFVSKEKVSNWVSLCCLLDAELVGVIIIDDLARPFI